MELTFGMSWVYYLVPSGEILQRHRDRAPVWGYVQMLIVTAIAATGAGRRVAADFIEGRATITAVAAVLAVAVPVGIFLGLMYALSYYLVRRFYVFQTVSDRDRWCRGRHPRRGSIRRRRRQVPRRPHARACGHGCRV
jgi:hypothetical protein